VPHAIAWRGHNPHQALPEHLVQSYPSLNAHTVGYGPFWENGIPEHLRWVGIELRRAQHPRFHRPPCDPLRSDFPSSVLTLA
jgi:hypothetical protein